MNGRQFSLVRYSKQILKVGQRIITLSLRFLFAGVGIMIALIAIVILVGNLWFPSQRGVPYRALAPDATSCKEDFKKGWDVLSKKDNDQVPNDEWSAIKKQGQQWRAKFTCVIQHHVIPGYTAADGSVRQLAYDLDFAEFQEDGKPYALREPCSSLKEDGCIDEGNGPVKRLRKTQIDAIRDSLDPTVPNYVMVWVHGWRNDASIGNANVAEFREYAALTARFLEDRALLDPKAERPHVTAIYVGWRGARTDENLLRVGPKS